MTSGQPDVTTSLVASYRPWTTSIPELRTAQRRYPYLVRADITHLFLGGSHEVLYVITMDYSRLELEFFFNKNTECVHSSEMKVITPHPFISLLIHACHHWIWVQEI